MTRCVALLEEEQRVYTHPKRLVHKLQQRAKRPQASSGLKSTLQCESVHSIRGSMKCVLVSGSDGYNIPQ